MESKLFKLIAGPKYSNPGERQELINALVSSIDQIIIEFRSVFGVECSYSKALDDFRSGYLGHIIRNVERISGMKWEEMKRRQGLYVVDDITGQPTLSVCSKNCLFYAIASDKMEEKKAGCDSCGYDNGVERCLDCGPVNGWRMWSSKELGGTNK